jgi:aspartate racemase
VSDTGIMMPQHIGIVGCSAEGAALCYRTICTEGTRVLGPHAHPEVSMHTPSLARYTACPDNTIHQAFAQVEPISPQPWLHIAEVVAAEADRRGYRRLGLLGTRWLVDSEVYPDQLAARGLQYLRPDAAERDEINRVIMDELVNGVITPEAITCHQRVIGRMKTAGCDAVVLGCTEIPLIMNDANSPLPVLDSTRLLAQAAVRRATEPRTDADA